MNYFFLFLSCVYVAVIFLMADTSVASMVSTFNLYSLLHIPLYGVLTILLVFSLIPFKSFHFRETRPVDQSGNSKGPVDANDCRSAGLKRRFAMVGLIVLVIALADEIHQSFIPVRDGSFYDVLLDLAGMVLALFSIRQWMKKAHKLSL